MKDKELLSKVICADKVNSISSYIKKSKLLPSIHSKGEKKTLFFYHVLEVMKPRVSVSLMIQEDSMLH